ncbi:hypothetical protein [Fodinicola acaciae]|uniref:hypothetical protein n=1 Tax=Fodinicola acaciae TaxID=2681555 RepID=UPI0013D4EFD2|nr:hypothetical protein [Fodinicola acaciae]
MVTPVQLAQVIRLALSTLSADNAHHTFEHLCRQVAKRRVVSNVIPATGPVSAGGDQGRDFETFHTYLSEELPFAIGFAALATTDVLAFACTIQKDDLHAKFKADITAICGQGTHVDRIYIFATASVPPRLRHDLQEWTINEYGVALDVIDGSALADLLAEPDLYWIAGEYLHLPAELASAAPAEGETQSPAWYVGLRDYWQESSREPASVGDLFDLRRGLRHSVFPGPARSDLAGWLTLMTRLVERSASVEVRLHAIYEIVIACSRGAADLRPAEPLVRQFIDEVQQSHDPTLLFNASLLVQWCTMAAAMRHSDIPLNDVLGWIPLLRHHVDRLLEQDWGPNARAALLQVATHLAFHIDYASTKATATTTLNDIDDMYGSLAEAIAQNTLDFALDPTGVVDLDAGMQHLAELVDLLPDAPVYPVGEFGKIIDVLAPILRDHPLYRSVCDGLDRAVARLNGDAAVGDRCRRRAETLLNANRLLDALHEFQQAKINWFHGDTMRATLLTLAAIADIYATLGMYLAAKKYALAMATFASDSADLSDREFIPLALFAASQMDHLAGAWIASAELARCGNEAHFIWAPDAGNFSRYPYLEQATGFQITAALVAEQTRPEFLPTIQDILEDTLFDISGLEKITPSSSRFRSEEEWTDWLPATQGAPFSDAGPRHTVTFHALGVRWTMHGRNEQDTVIALEDFASTLQILLVEFSALDLLLITQDVDIEIHTYQCEQPPADVSRTQVIDNRRSWRIYMPAEHPPGMSPLEQLRDIMVPLALQTVMAHSLLNRRQFNSLLASPIREQLFTSLAIGGPYRTYALFPTKAASPPIEPQYRPLTNIERPNPRAGAPQMKSRTGAGPGYSSDRAQQILIERYEHLSLAVQYTIPTLLSHSHVRDLFHDLRREGWKDWHLLNVIAGLTVSHRVRLRGGAPTAEMPSQTAEAWLTEALRAEQPNDPQLPPSQVTRGAMEQGIHFALVNCLHDWDLSGHQSTTAPAAVLQILAERYRFWDDDVLHRDPFLGQLD